MRNTHVVVIGSGFGGLAAAKQLAKSDIETTLISANGEHLFQPLLYQVATGVVDGARIAPPIAEVLRRKRTVDVVTGYVTAVDADRKVITYATADGIEQIRYTYLIVAAGAAQAYFGHDEWAERTFALKTLDDAKALRARVLRAFDAPADDVLRDFVIVGAGATGVEVAGQLAELARKHHGGADVRINLVEGAGDVLPVYGGKLSDFTRATLEKAGVNVLTDTFVTAIDDDAVTVKGKDGAERTVPAGTVVWSAGVKANPLAGIIAEATGCETDRAGRLLVNRDLTVGGRADVFALGDMTNLNNLPGQSPVAMQQGRHAADIIRGARGQGTHFSYLDKGSMAMIDTPNAVIEAPMNLPKLTGFVAWVGWLAVHLYYLAGMGNRIAVLRDWVLAFVGKARPGFAEAERERAVEPAAGAELIDEAASADLGVTGLPDGPRNVPVA
ncbi:NADH:ubiquinone reductase (non-electrogenic) OS=Tsukamurella paurometabola (strain ATCC 8368 / DSM / CCUG 35730 / CIP 100753 / JCM 10117 / KCTC 9821 / NBRC 16120 / NCIMB 702349 / NCTC 13040) OX=521096 GN=Tpau_1325 PE=3 SV=1 [Tsukamurella paurometabola]|uniref:NADH:ubiquinone reductase (non-electrogenic) n=1 Tax=Tsukamurella paurometabola (strain ATCC 8368 / DSM 20162 / CCUG 35730 / CIP 100753 / JCM 10117 / KCTC 9821 / NBRC 16120 / NCIMB 702349 / NCTC 13040) TaxID=521096 RepID=D5UWT2_TSUPD|nr:NAD(P)/FAD-dependent oxidoreductase [Tsukamurella paurometabola]ADG77954.1 FAD-dependent pyridine nucleotide-disulfide oxidoreductase [Tsukamurella paurometabola DSM 20162]SUP29504.1 NADH dehydrogenase-like protein SAV0941 [Tsukamurella paurometabola]